LPAGPAVAARVRQRIGSRLDFAPGATNLCLLLEQYFGQ
jgi:hypothetical protein